MAETLRKAARHVRHLALTGVHAVGGFRRLAESEWRRQRLLILCYHGVSLRDEHEWNGTLFVSPGFLRRRFEILRDGGYTVLRLDEAVGKLRRGSLPPRSVVLTFDDGFHDFFSAAMPLLEEFAYPATNYMSSYYCVDQRPIPTVALDYLLWRAGPRRLAPATLPGQDRAVDLHEPRQRRTLASKLLDQARAGPGAADAQDALLHEVAARLEIDWDDVVRSRLFHVMTPAEVTATARRGFDVQLHTHRHRTPREKSAFCGEVSENRCILEEMTGHRATHFCYPSGDVDPMFLPWLRMLGVASATTTAAGMAAREDDPLLLPRYVDTMAQSEVTFESWLSGARAVLKSRAHEPA
jgi:peptidoglycan/xylan/chitin deacetylase (PgdA/CDA1 family)